MLLVAPADPPLVLAHTTRCNNVCRAPQPASASPRTLVCGSDWLDSKIWKVATVDFEKSKVNFWRRAARDIPLGGGETMATSSGPPTIEEHIDASGLGLYQLKIFIISALVAIADG